MTETTIYRLTPRETVKFIDETLQAGLVPFVRSSPGMGKSTLNKKVCNSWNLQMIDHRGTTSVPEDMSGLPEFYNDSAGIRRARFVPFDTFPVVGTPLPEGKDGWMLFFDEFNSADKMVQAACYKIMLDKMVGQTPLHERVVISAAGNLDTDRAIVTNLSTAMQSRLIHAEMEISHPEFMEDVVYAQNWDPTIAAYLNYAPQDLMDFRPDHSEKTFCCPRTWEFMNKHVSKFGFGENQVTKWAGTITSGTAVAFHSFAQLQNDLVTIREVLADPLNAPVPDMAQRKWMISMHLLRSVDDKNFADIATYMGRLDMATRVQFLRGLQVNHDDLRSHPSFARMMIDLSAYLHR